MLEVAAPPAGLLRAGHKLWFEHVVPLLGAVLSDADAYRYLPRSTAYLPDEVGLRRLFVRPGSRPSAAASCSGGLSQLLTGTRAGMPVAV